MKDRKLVYGVGVNDADYVVQIKETIRCVDGKQKQKTVWTCPFYQAWKNMLQRCYSKKYQEGKPSYIGCTVSEDWLTFTNFKIWMQNQDFEGKHLDKDLLFEGNKVYGPETCVFVPSMVNSFISEKRASRGKWLIGVYWDKQTEKFLSRCGNPFSGKQEYLGRFTCEQQAHEAWRKRKLELAYELAAIQTDERVAEALISRYSK